MTYKPRIWILFTLLAACISGYAERTIFRNDIERALQELVKIKDPELAAAKAKQILEVFRDGCITFNTSEIDMLPPKLDVPTAIREAVRKPLETLVESWHACRVQNNPKTEDISAKEDLSVRPGNQKWQAVRGFPGVVRGLAANDRVVIAGGQDGGIWISTDHGETFHQARRDGPSNAQNLALEHEHFQAMAVKDEIIYAGGGLEDTFHEAYKSFWFGQLRSGEVAWQPIEFPESVSEFSAIAVGNTGVFAATEKGVFGAVETPAVFKKEHPPVKYLTASPSYVLGGAVSPPPIRRYNPQFWDKITIGLEHLSSQVSVLAASGSHIYLGSSDGDVFELCQNAQNWVRFPRTLPGKVVAIAASQNTVFAASGRSVFRTEYDACSSTASLHGGVHPVWTFYNGPDQHPTYKIVGLAVSGKKLLAGRSDGIYITSVDPSGAGTRTSHAARGTARAAPKK